VAALLRTPPPPAGEPSTRNRNQGVAESAQRATGAASGGFEGTEGEEPQPAAIRRQFASPALGGLPHADRPISVDSLEEGQARLRARIEQLLDPLRTRYLERRIRLRETVDTPEEYVAVNKKCPGGWRY